METGRVEAFSDGVFAIAITLLILAVGIEEALAKGEVADHLIEIWPAYLAYAVSFVTVGIMWANHHLVFRQFARVDRPLLLLNVLLLMMVAFTPYPTRVVAEAAHTAPDRREVSGITRSYLPGTPLYGTATLLALVSPIASLIMFATLAVFYAFSSAVFGRDDVT